MITHGKGGWSWETLYHLPIHLRNFYMMQLSDQLEAERNAHKQPAPSSRAPVGPAVNPK